VPSLPDLPQTEIAIVEMTNAFRKENRLGEVKPNAALAAAARAFAEYLARTGKFAHEADGREPADRATAQGYRYCLVAENLALNLDSRGFETRQLAGDVLKGWKDSPGHRANLLQATATEIGVAVVRAPDRNPKFLSVQLFGRPEALKVTFRIENRSGNTVHYRLGSDAQALPPRTIVTQTDCGMEPLGFDGVPAASGRFAPRDCDRYVLSGAAQGGLKIDVVRK
jgi:Cysteine-rich secretory protein family